MPSPPERTAAPRVRPRPRSLAVMLLAGLALAAGGCGKGALRREPSTVARSGAPHGSPPPRSAHGRQTGASVAVPLPLTAARADAFARAVTLHSADLPGAVPAPRSHTPGAEEREAARCGGSPAVALGGGSSPDFHRGAGLDRESISSSVQVLSGAAAVRSDLAYASSHAGLACYAKVLGKSLRAEQDRSLRVRGVRVGLLEVAVGPSQQASGIRVTADVEILGAGVNVRLFVDALSLPYGPAELDLYSTSFVQPAPERTERELLELLRERALLQTL